MEIKRVEKTVYTNKYVTFDGCEFDTMNKCDDYEKRELTQR